MMNGHWFWDENPPRDLPTLLNFYYTSVGRGSILMLNVAPDKRGRFSDECLARLHEFHEALTKIFSTDFAAGKTATASNVPRRRISLRRGAMSPMERRTPIGRRTMTRKNRRSKSTSAAMSSST